MKSLRDKIKHKRMLFYILLGWMRQNRQKTMAESDLRKAEFPETIRSCHSAGNYTKIVDIWEKSQTGTSTRLIYMCLYQLLSCFPKHFILHQPVPRPLLLQNLIVLHILSFVDYKCLYIQPRDINCAQGGQRSA